MMDSNVAAGTGGAGTALVSALRGIGRALYETYRRGGRTMVAAPAIAAIAILPELAQHVVEIAIGMFVSVAEFRAHAADPLRMGFGYVKVAGFVLAIVMAARFQATESVRAAMLIRPATLLRLVLALAMMLAAAFGLGWMAERLPHVAGVVVSVVSFLLQCGLTLYVVAAMLDDRTVTLRRVFTDRWPSAVVMTILLAATFGPAQALHMANHKLAIGRPVPVVWSLMTFDALFLGLFAALVGAALYVGHTSGASWRGWGGGPGARRAGKGIVGEQAA